MEMTSTEDKPKPDKPSVLDRVSKFYKEGSATPSWIFGVLFAGFLIYVFFAVPHPTPTQCGLIRFFMALAGGLLFFFLVGGVFLEGQLKGFTIGAGGGAVVLVLMEFVFNPVPGCVKLAIGTPDWSGGQQLGELIDTLRRERAVGGENIPKIEVSEEDEDRIMHFNPNLPKVSGNSWAELLQRICESTDGCLLCDISKDQKTVKLATSGKWIKTVKGSDSRHYEYSCRR